MRTKARTVQKLWPIDRIKPYDANPRTHPVEQIKLLADLMRKHGVDQPIVVDDGGVIIKGHGRRLAAIEAGLKEFPVVVRAGLSDEEKMAMRISDNSVALLAGWNADLIRGEISSLKLAGYNVALLGFPETQLRGWGISGGTESEQDPEALPDTPAKIVVRRGDLWLLGEHRLLCGDATKAQDVATLLGDDKPHLMVTDPPYGVEYNPDWRAGVHRRTGEQKTYAARGRVGNDATRDWTPAWKLFPGSVAYVWHASYFVSTAQCSLEAAGFAMRCHVIWRKAHFSLGRGDYHWQHEPMWYCVRDGASHWNGGRNQASVWDITSGVGFSTVKTGPGARTGHSTQKPIECMKRPIENNSRGGDWIYDPFVGSGTTIIAAEISGRRSLTIELDPSYCQIAIMRWQEYTGRLATCGGRTLDQRISGRRSVGTAQRRYRAGASV